MGWLKTIEIDTTHAKADETTRNIPAEDAYREAFELWQHASTAEEKRMLESWMDELQPAISYNADDPRWIAFRATVPGMEEFWSSGVVNILAGMHAPAGPKH